MKLKLKNLSLFVLSSLLFVSCDKSDVDTTTKASSQKNSTAKETLSTDFPENIISYNIPLTSDLNFIQGQTPISINTSKTTAIRTTDPVIHYSSIILSSVQHTEENLKINLSDNEKTENYITIHGYKYNLQQFHFHYHSEHNINGEYGIMEIHFVNKSDSGAYAVLGVLVKVGKANKSLETLIIDSPSEIGTEEFTDSFDLKSILPENTKSYYSYSGSLTTPNLDTTPNQGPLTWIVFKENKQMTTKQLDAYKEKYEEENFRVIQPLNGRKVYENK
jgi:carbonic anhydrase